MSIQNSLLIGKGYIPLDTGWTLKMGILDLLNSKNYIEEVLQKQQHLSQELGYLQDVINNWHTKKLLGVESELIYKCFKLASAGNRLKRKIEKKGNLIGRDFGDEEMQKAPLEKLMVVDPSEYGWAAAHILVNHGDERESEHYQLILASKAVKHWEGARSIKVPWRVKYDDGIIRQAENFESIMNSGRINFVLRGPKDYSFARAFELAKPSDVPARLSEYVDRTESALKEYESSVPITTNEDGIIWALAMKSKFFGDKVSFKNPDAAKKSWPKFWEFLEHYSS